MIAVTAVTTHTSLGYDFDLYGASQTQSAGKDYEYLDVFGDSVPVCYANKPDLSVLANQKIKKNMTSTDLLGVCAAVKTAKKVDITRYRPQRVGLFVGCGSSQLEDLMPYESLTRSCFHPHSGFDFEKFGQELLGSVHPMVLLHSLMNNILCYVSIELGIKGVNGNYVELQTSGFRALLEAYRCMRLDLCDAALVCAVSSKLGPLALHEAKYSNEENLFEFPFGEAAVCLLLEKQVLTDPLFQITHVGLGAAPNEKQNFEFTHLSKNLRHLIGHTQEAAHLLDISLGAEFLLRQKTCDLSITAHSFSKEYGQVSLRLP